MYFRQKHVDSLTKPNFLLVNILIEYVNGTKDFTFFKTWGYKNKTEKWYDGMIGEMQKDRIELSGKPNCTYVHALKLIISKIQHSYNTST